MYLCMTLSWNLHVKIVYLIMILIESCTLRYDFKYLIKALSRDIQIRFVHLIMTLINVWTPHYDYKYHTTIISRDIHTRFVYLIMILRWDMHTEFVHPLKLSSRFVHLITTLIHTRCGHLTLIIPSKSFRLAHIMHW